jgi:hypothetical protein
MKLHSLVCCLGLAAATSSWAQSFPEGASVPTAEDLKSRLSDKTFGVTLANGSTWRLQFNANGYFFFNTSTGSNGSGQWNTQDGKICSKVQTPGSELTCGDARIHNDILHVRRSNGEVIRYVPR